MRELRLTQAFACARPLMVFAFGILITLFTSIGALAQCDPADGAIEGRVFMDSQADGTIGTGESGIANVMVTAYNAEGVSLGFAMSDEDGAYSIPDLTDGEKVALIFSYANTLSTGILGPDNASNVQYTEVPSCNNNIGLVDLSASCGTNPEILLTCFSQGTYNGTNRKLETILGIEHNFNNSSSPKVYARAEETGSVWGLAWKNSTQDIFSSAFVKQYSGLKDGPGAVYKTSYNGSEYETTLFADLSTLGVNVAPLTNTDVFDCDYGAQVGKYGLGSIVLSPDEQWLYTINLSDNTLVRFSSTNPRAATTTVTAIPDPGCSNGDARAFALVFRGNDIYVGVTCTAETSYANGGLPSELEKESSANVFKYSPDSGNWNLEFTTNYIKGYWRDDFQDSYKTIHWLTDLDFTDDGNMLISLTDRVGHRFCNDNERIDGQNPDLLVVFKNAAGQWELENNGQIMIDGQTVEGTGVGNLEGPGGGEFFAYDHWLTDPGYHSETALGSIVVLPGSRSVVAMVYDPITSSYSGGMHRYDTSNGEKISAKQLYTRDFTANLGKATGFGNLVIGCGEQPIEIGNYVWYDNNNNGAQDAGENGFGGIPLELLDGSCNTIAKTTTDARGYYAFNISNVDRDQDGFFDGLLSNETYYVKVGHAIDQTGSYYSINGNEFYVCSESEAGTQTNCDISIIDGVCNDQPVVQVTTGDFGVNDHTFDIGLYTPQILDIALRKELLSNNMATYGSLVDFKITIFNQGDKVVRGVTITDYLNDAYTFNESDNPGWSRNGDMISYKHAGDIARYGEEAFYLRLQVGDFALANELLNYAEISGAVDNNGPVVSDIDSSFDQIDDNDSGGAFNTDSDDMIDDSGVKDEDDHDVAGPRVFDLALKIEDKEENKTYRAGDRVDFVISVYNQGLVDAKTVGVVNYIPEGLDFLEADRDDWTVAGNQMTFVDTDGLVAGTKKTYCISFRINENVGALDQLINNAEISHATIEGDLSPLDYDSTADMIMDNDKGGLVLTSNDNLVSDHGENDEDDADPVVVRLSYVDLALRKTAVTTVARHGELATFKIEVINQGSLPVKKFTVVDYYPSDLRLEDDLWQAPSNNGKAFITVDLENELKPGGSHPLLVTFRVSEDSDAVSIINYAEITEVFDAEGNDISEMDVDSTPDDSFGNDKGGVINTLDDNNIDGTRLEEEDDHDPARIAFIQSSVVSTCGCANADAGYFANEIKVTSDPDQSWHIDQVVGAYSNTSTEGDLVAIETGNDGDEFSETPMGMESMYNFSFFSLDGQPWQITVRNENDDIVELSGGACNTEAIIVDGAFSLCQGSTETYTVTNPVAGEIYEWDLASGGTILSQTPTTVTIEWESVSGGPHDLVVSNASMVNANCQSPTTVGGVGVTIGQADGPMTCIGDVNISLNQNCEVLVRPQTVAAGPLDPLAPYSVMLTLPDGTLIPNNLLTADHIGIEVTAKLIEGCGGNSCWATISVEDKLPPVIEANDTEIVCYNYDEYNGPLAVDACDGIVETYQVGAEDIYVYDCHPDYVRRVTRTYQAEDSKGNVSDLSTVVILVKKININDIVYPADIVGTDAFACDEVEYNADGFPTLETTGVPTINGEPLIPGVTPLCNIAMDYNDRLVGPIGCTTKVMREFRLVYNTCQFVDNGTTIDSIPMTQVYKYTQTIELEDNNPPVFVQMADITVSSGSGDCEASVFLPAPEVSDACADDIEIDIRYPGGFANDQSSTFVLLEGGTSEVTYLAYDECGNVDSMKINVTVMDMTAPVVVCDVPTALGINSNGIGYAYAASFDDGSTDACGIDYMQVRRLDDGADCGPESTTFGDFVVFCCADVGNEVMVEFQVVDFAGNANSCMVSVVVQDKFPPVISCPADVTVDCGTPFDLDDLDEYGTATATDACMVTVEEDATYAPINACGEGVITRTFVASDNNGSATCTQTITFVNNAPFVGSNITFPPNYDTEICDRDALEPEELPAPYNEPLINDDACDMISFTHSDQIFDFTGDNACYKIYRTWTVINWCVMVNDTPQTFEGFQVIKVSNTIAPEIVEDSEPLMACSFDDSCELGNITLTKSATDDCTLPENLRWSYIINLESGEVITDNGIGNAVNASGDYELGSHTITYTFEDRCGNVVSSIQEFSIQNCTPPSAVCIDGLSVELVPMDTDNDGIVDAEMACLFATQLNASSAHTCDLPLVYSFSADTSFTKQFFDCSHLGENEVTLWVTDSNGNTDICISTLIVQDNNDVDICPSIEDCVTFPENTTITTCNADLTPVVTGLIPIVDTDCSSCNDFDITFTDEFLTYPNSDCNYIERSFVVTFNCFMSPMIVEGSHIISLLDVVAPTINCPADGAASATDGTGLSCEAFVSLDPATFVSNCNSVVTITNDSAFADATGADASGTYPVGITPVTFTATDACGNESTCSINVSVTDEMGPTCNLQDVTISVASGGTATIEFADIDNGSSDACGGLITGIVTPNTFTCDDIGQVNLISVIIEDESGNQTICSDAVNVTVTVVDNEAPICSAQDITVSIAADATSVTITPPMIDNGSTDGCGIVQELSLDQTTFGCNELGVQTVTLTVTDQDNNTSTCTALVTVEEEVLPTCDAGTVTLTLDTDGTVTLDPTDLDNGSTDDCGTIAGFTASQTIFTCADIGSNTVELTVTDSYGNASTCTGTVIIVENGAPMCATQDITVSIIEGTTSISIEPSDVDAGSTDACGTASLVSVTPNVFDCTDLGANEVVLTVTDQNDNTSTCNAIVTVEETVAPNCDAGTQTILIGANGIAIVDAEAFGANSTDDCGAIATYSVLPESFTCDELGPNTVTLTVTDNFGNSSTCTGTVIVEENEAPTCAAKDITVNILDGTTSISIVPSDVDDGSTDGCGVATLVSVTPDTFTCNDLGENTVTLTVQDNSGNTSTCTSIVTVGDLVPPTCNAGTFIVTLTDTGSVTVTGEDLDNGSTDDCGTIVTYSVSPDTFDCTNAGDNTVTLTVTDNNGNSSMCEGTVTVIDNVAPICNTQDITISLDDNGATLINALFINDGSVDPCGGALQSLTVSPFSFNCEDIGDNIVVMTAVDANGNSSTCEAVVTIEDTDAPTCEVQDITVSLTAESGVSVDAEDFDNGSTDECGGPLTFEVDQSVFTCDDLGTDNPVVITVTDQYGNASTCTANVTVEDDIEIQCVAQDITVSFESNGAVSITPEQIDNGSSAGCDQPLALSLDMQDFVCNDASDNPIEVTLTVTVIATGETSQCTANVTLVDDVDPTITCMDDVTVNCEDFTGSLEAYGNEDDIITDDNCDAGLELTETVVEDVNSCGIGTYTRTFVVSDLSGNSASCTQVVTVVLGNNPLVEEDLTFPPDTLTFGDCSSFDPGNLNTTVVIDSMAADCFNVSISFVDSGINVDMPCNDTITRTYTVLDSCQIGTGGGVFTFDQTIIINDTEAPMITGPEDLTVTIQDTMTCTFALDLSGFNVDNCDENFTVTNNSAFANDQDSGDASGDYPVGEYEITLTATDDCNNSSEYVYNVTVLDTTYVKFTCLKIQPPMEDDLSVDVHISQMIDTLEYFNCLGIVSDTIISFSNTNVNDTIRTYGCEAVSQPVTTRVYVFVDGVVVDSCKSTVQLMDVDDLCNDGLVGTVLGTVFTADNEAVPNVLVDLEGSDQSIMTDENGYYAFPNMIGGDAYVVKPTKDDNPMNGVTTLDLILIQRHILGLSELDSPYDLIAADIDASGSLSGIDIIQLRKMILGIYSEFPSNTSWRMVDREFTFWDPTNAQEEAFPETYDIDALVSTMKADFIGVKTGDVNGSVVANALTNATTETRSENTWYLQASDKTVRAGEAVTVEIMVSEDTRLQGFQLGMAIDKVRDITLSSASINITEDNYTVDRTGAVSISWNTINEIELSSGSNILELTIVPSVDGKLSDMISVQSEGILSQTYVDNDIAYNRADILWDSVKSDFTLYQNKPNPWTQSTDISFMIPVDGKVTINVRSVNGQLVKSIDGYYESGVHSVKLTNEDLIESGVYYYEMRYDNQIVVEKMILLR